MRAVLDFMAAQAQVQQRLSRRREAQNAHPNVQPDNTAVDRVSELEAEKEALRARVQRLEETNAALQTQLTQLQTQQQDRAAESLDADAEETDHAVVLINDRPGMDSAYQTNDEADGLMKIERNDSDARETGTRIKRRRIVYESDDEVDPQMEADDAEVYDGEVGAGGDANAKDSVYSESEAEMDFKRESSSESGIIEVVNPIVRQPATVAHHAPSALHRFSQGTPTGRSNEALNIQPPSEPVQKSKPKAWTPAEDLKLLEGVQKHYDSTRMITEFGLDRNGSGVRNRIALLARTDPRYRK